MEFGISLLSVGKPERSQLWARIKQFIESAGGWNQVRNASTPQSQCQSLSNSAGKTRVLSVGEMDHIRQGEHNLGLFVRKALNVTLVTLVKEGINFFWK